jgi:DNA polymerase
MDAVSTHDRDDGPVVTSLSALREAENNCRRCRPYKYATQEVQGQGPRCASMMLIGEQPGD